MHNLRVLIDACIGTACEDRLRSMSVDVLTVRELDPTMADTDVLKLAADQDRILVTLDHDFAQLVFVHEYEHAGVLLLRMPGARGPDKADALAAIVRSHGDELAGSFSVYHAGQLRIRPLEQS